MGCQEEVGLKDSELSYLIFALKCHFFYSHCGEKVGLWVMHGYLFLCSANLHLSFKFAVWDLGFDQKIWWIRRMVSAQSIRALNFHLEHPHNILGRMTSVDWPFAKIKIKKEKKKMESPTWLDPCRVGGWVFFFKISVVYWSKHWFWSFFFFLSGSRWIYTQVLPMYNGGCYWVLLLNTVLHLLRQTDFLKVRHRQYNVYDI